MKAVILLVEDNREILDFIESNLCDQYTVKKTANGKEALEVLRNEIVDLIVSDVMMPQMDGFELCRIIKSDVELSHLPCILLTAKNTLQARLQGLELGADVYIEKPFSPKHLKIQISNLLENRNKIKNYFANSPLAQLKTIAHTKADEKFLETVNHIIEEHLQEPELDVDRLARYLNMSRPTFYRKINAISDLTPNDLINLTRLKKAARLMSDGHNINEVSEMVGYNSPKIFSKNFEKQFGMMPSEYISGHLKG
ncbi:response regulator transcription factor [Niabella ginsenosidivorans]|uniref:response regulator transcription factor n=1 Tax=Niabella ginsenosidivorans TaxID=1176587 RepID=UPI0009FE91F5|nr:response regulator [Niabella ginsenosidivorans]